MKLFGFVICNGESRKDFDLEELRPYGLIFGCNILYWDFKPDMLFAGEQNVIDKIKEDAYDGATSFRLRDSKREFNGWTGSGSREVVDDEGWACGPSATLYMCQEAEVIFLVAADIFSRDGKHDNMYKGVKDLYRPADAEYTSTVNFINQWRTIFKRYPEHQFYRVTYPGHSHPQDWVECPNVKTITYEQMIQILEDLTCI